MIEKENEIVQILEKLSNTIEELKNSAVNSHPDVYIWKKVEDGILDNIANANELQLKRLRNYNFKYYIKFNTDRDLLDNLIQDKIREETLNELIDND
jgi:hypothetical protein